MKFWDSSAVLPLIFRESASESVANLVRGDGDIAVWWGTWAECAVAISRQKREGGFDDETEEDARVRLGRLAEDWYEVEPTGDLRLLAMIVSRDHHLKAADCLQLASALRWCGEKQRMPGSYRWTTGYVGPRGTKVSPYYQSQWTSNEPLSPSDR